MRPSFSENSMTDWKTFIESFMDDAGIIHEEDIQKIIPYGDDFFFLNKAYGLTESEIKGDFLILDNQLYVQSHFIHSPIMPGCLVAESFAQVGTILVRYNLGKTQQKGILVGTIEKARFKIPVKPGQLIKHYVKLNTLNIDLGIARLSGDTKVNGEVVASYKLILVILDRK